MDYILKPQTGDSLAIPQLVLNQVERMDGDTIRVALYLLKGGSFDPAQIARDLKLKSNRIAENALQFWVGAGLLERKGNAPLRPLLNTDTEQLNEAAFRDPMVSMIVSEVEMHFGKALSHVELSKLAALYQSEQFQADVILLCVSHMSSTQQKCTVGRLAVELGRWRDAGVETSADAESYLRREELRRKREAEVAPLFGIKQEELTYTQKSSIHRWFESWDFDLPMVQEALLHADGKNTIRYVGGILRAWHAQGFTQPSQVRGSGSLQGSNITVTAAAQKQISGAIQGVFHQDWNSIFDD